MIYNLYAYFDRVGKVYGSPLVLSNDEVAKRNFNLDMQKSQFPDDICLYRLGTYNIETGEIVSSVEFIQSYSSVGVANA